ncbi:MAG: LacI family DNA-binding transcriptional regulator [Chloroflexi bacterium]|nr:LacI family DNA-binding transcriptional regulator [Chloroflexota bacterium]MBV9893873.1 LacI family DNA-binding transcriptional regulator [Chloroflexota bacterium]
MSLTIKDIATLAGVSRSTVSRVLNNRYGVKPAVREHVLSVIREHNYSPQAAARNLASARSDCIGLLIPRSASVSFGDPFIATMIQALVEAAAQQGYFAMLAMVTTEREAGFYDRIVRGRHFDGVIMFSSDIDDPILPLLIKDGSPLVLIGRHPYFTEVASVDVENRQGARDAVAHLIQRGHRRIGLINGELQMEAALARRDGYKQALLEAGLPIDADLMVEGFYSHSGAYEAMQTLLKSQNPPTAVFAASDRMAVGALEAVRNSGLRVPEDVAIVGFDDLVLAVSATPPLSSVAQPIGIMATEAIQLLIEQIRGESAPRSVRLFGQLVVRESSGGSERSQPNPKGGSVLVSGR